MSSGITFEVVAQRLKNALSLRSDMELAKALEIRANAFYNRKAAGSLPYEQILKLAGKHDLCADWVFFGIGEPFRAGGERSVAPVAELNAVIFQEICGELELALLGANARRDHKQDLYRAGVRGGLAAFIYSRVAFIENEKLRSAAIRLQAEGMAHAAGVAKDVSLEFPPESRETKPPLKSKSRGSTKRAR